MSRKLLPSRLSTSSISRRDSSALPIRSSSSTARKRDQFSPNSKRSPRPTSIACVLIPLNPSVTQTVVDHLHVLPRDRLPAARAKPPSPRRRSLQARLDLGYPDLHAAPLERPSESPQRAPRVIARSDYEERAQRPLARVLPKQHGLVVRAPDATRQRLYAFVRHARFDQLSPRALDERGVTL